MDPSEISMVHWTKHRPGIPESQDPCLAIHLLCDIWQVTSPAWVLIFPFTKGMCGFLEES